LKDLLAVEADMGTPEILIPAIRQYKHNTGGDGFVVGYDKEGVNKIVIDLQNQIIDLKACLRTCANSAKGGLDQYS
jgi:hypothetical protein